MNKKDPTYSEEQIQEKLKAFPGWWYEDGWIRRNYKTDGWPTTLMLVTAIGYLAEAAYHHPDLAVPPDTDLVLIPGLCEGDPAAIAAKARTRVEKGPKDLREIPDYFGHQATPPPSGGYDIEIVAEVNNAPRLPREAVRQAAQYYRASGADVIDIGWTPGLAYPDPGAVVGELVAADTTGVNALLVAICEEVGVRAVLTTEVIPWARGAVREIDIARRLMHHAVTRQALPKGVDDRLVTLKDPKILAYGEAELRALHRAVTDPNFRIFADEQVITVFNNEIFVRGTDINDLFAQLGVAEATHAFYLGRELMKAKIAITLGKTYRQEGQLQWGYLTPQEEPSQHVLLTQRSGRRPARR